jgi:nitrogen regulatory protein P-II 1
MKRIEIIVPDRKLKDANEVIRDANTGGMSYYRIEGKRWNKGRICFI